MDITIKDILTNSETVVIFTKGEAFGSMLGTFVKSPNGAFKVVVPKERVDNKDYPWIESTLAEIYDKQFNSTVKASDFTATIALEKSITIGITIGNDKETAVVESADYMETAEELNQVVH